MAEVLWTAGPLRVRDGLGEAERVELDELLGSLAGGSSPGGSLDGGLRSLGVLGSRYLLIWHEEADGTVTVVRLVAVVARSGG